MTRSRPDCGSICAPPGGRFAVEWYRAEDGVAQKGVAIEGGREIELISPFTGHDVVLRLRKNARQ